MTREEFKERVEDAIERFLDDFELFEPDPHLSVNPETLYVDVVSGKTMAEGVEDSDEAIENAAAAEGAADKDALDRQAGENPDYYPVYDFLIVHEGKATKADGRAIRRLVDKYIG